MRGRLIVACQLVALLMFNINADIDDSRGSGLQRISFKE